MNRSKIIVLVTLINLVFASLYFNACNSPDQLADKKEPFQSEIDSLVSSMTLEEKVSMLHGNSKFANAGIERLGIPEWVLSDGPHGVREEIQRHSWDPAGWTNDSSTYFPTGTALAATWNPELALGTGEALGEEARARGKDVLLGPGVNIHRSPLCGRNFEYMSEDPVLTTAMCVPYIKGVQSKDVAACVKHYALNNQETNRTTVDVQVSERALYEIYLPAFKAAVEEAEVHTIMGAYNKFRGVYCCENKYLLKDILRDEWNFKGVVISDWDATHSTVDAALNGLDLEMGTDVASYDDYYFSKPLIQAVKDGLVPESIVDEKVGNILRVMYKTKILGASNREKGSYNTPEHYEAAYKVAKESIVLLKNSKNLLPIDQNKIKSVAIIGDNATRKHCEGGFSSGVKAKKEVTPLEGIKNLLGKSVKINFSQGYEKTSELDNFIRITDNTLNEELLNSAVASAKASDVAIIFAGLNHDYDSEGLDKSDMLLPYQQDILIKAVAKANPNTIVVFHAGSPVDMSSFSNEISAMVWGWLNGSEGGTAIAQMLFGVFSPSGKMPFTLPVHLEDSPAHALDSYPGVNHSVNYTEDLLVGYRWFDTKNIRPLFAFGHGLSYTQFTISNVTVDKNVFAKDETAVVSLNIKNDGDFDGAETIQLYAHDVESSVIRPFKELKSFKKVFLNSEEEKTIQLELPVNNLSFYNSKTKTWELEPGDFKLMIGNASNNIFETVDIQIK
ncbi:beta-glucosidase [Mangrovibacterium sp.]|uniref:beta-glucosidase n=1 Tax=Mangrovibacterium sp. TaxID=1961364 RepID=UPI0035664FA9